MRSPSEESSVKLTVTLSSLEFEHFVEHGMHCLEQLSDLGVTRPMMPRPATYEEARDIAILGIQEMIAICVRRSSPRAHEYNSDEDIPF